MNKKILSIIAIFTLILVIPTADAQLTIGSEVKQDLIEVKINDKGEVDVKHIARASNMPGTLHLFSGTISNLVVTNEMGEEKESGIVNDAQGKQSVFVLPSKQNSIIKYNLENIILKDNLFSTQFSYAEKFSIIFDDKIELIFVNNNPIDLENKKGISVNGGGEAKIEFYSNIPKMIKEVKWEENNFDIEITTDSEIKNFNFNQPEKSLSFQVNDENKFVTISMSEELLGGPYVTLLDDVKIKHAKFVRDGNIVSLSLKPEATGQITIIGTTVIPEFSMFIPLIMGFLIILTVPFMKKINLH
jgi:predicted DNA binding CopG/RHH family protein